MSYTFNENIMSQVNSDFNMFKPGQEFPPRNVKALNNRFRFEDKMFRGTYNDGVELQVTCLNSANELITNDIPYRKMTINKFKTMTNKSVSLVFGIGDFDYKGRTTEQTKLLRDLVEKRHWIDGIRSGYEILQKNANVILRTNKYGVNSINPTNGFKIVDEHDKNVIKAVVIYDILSDKVNEHVSNNYVRVELHCNGHTAERVYEYKGGYIGKPVKYKYRGRIINEAGNYYDLPFKDKSVAEWVSINKTSDPSGIYGLSHYWDFAPLVFKYEELLSIETMVVETNAKPLLAVASRLIKPDERGNGYKLAKIEGAGYNIIPLKDGDNPPQFVNNANAQLDHSRNIREDIDGLIYELMEMNKSFLQGSYKGNIDNDTLNTIVRGCIDRAERHWWEIYYSIKNSLYVLAQLNGIDIPFEDIEIIANIGINENQKELADISSSLINNNILSKESVRIKYFGMTKEQSDSENEQIKKEGINNEMV